VRPFQIFSVSQSRKRSENTLIFLATKKKSKRRKNTMSTIPNSGEQLRAEVRTRYARTALQVMGTTESQADACCAPGCCSPSTSTRNAATQDGGSADDPITANLYSQSELGTIPLAAALASRGCGNPTALAELLPGEKVLDLGSGGGIDVLLSARRVGPSGFAYGLDMTDAMLELAERNRVEAGIENVQFLKGIIEDIPLPDQSVQVIISNCVINLSADKGQVLREAYRVLTPGGRVAISDIVFQGQFPAALQADLESWAGCIAGTLEEQTYRQLLQEAGFTGIEIEVTRHYSLDDVRQSGGGKALEAVSEQELHEIDGKFVSAFVRARKP
jgi:arsenite methyltransferase